MNLLPKSYEQFSQKEYWDTFFKKRGKKAFEWYGEYPELSEHLHKYIKQQDNVLITGCGNSTIGRDLYDIGYNNVTNIDISHVVIKQMLSQNEKDRPNLKYIQMNALETSFKDEEFSVVLDKGTLDALMPDNNVKTVSKINKYFNEIQRVLKIGGRYICISLLQEHILKMLLSYFPSNNWMFRVVKCFGIESNENSMPVFVVICTKFKSLPKLILEINLSSTDKMQRLETVQDVITNILNAQQAEFICSNLKQCSIADENEVSLDLYKPGEAHPRFTVYVVDVVPKKGNSQYAAFVVPQGRESEWLFSTEAGRKKLVKMTKCNRLAIIAMHRYQTYSNFQGVQNELNETVCNLAPLTLKDKKILFLSLGSDVGNRQVKYEGSSEYSGKYVIEDVEISDQKFRRLFYLNSQFVIQSEAKLKTIKSKKGVIKEVIDLTYLTCRHHIYMSLATYLTCKNNQSASIVIIGLGGGGLCSFLHKFLPKTNILGVDVDNDMLKVAVDWFGLQQNDKLKATIMDGLKFLENIANTGQKLDAILFDVDNKDSSIGMSCPPKDFLETSVLENIIKILNNSGLFILNVVLRDETLRPEIFNKLKQKFLKVTSYKLEEDLNEIFICGNENIQSTIIKNNLKSAAKEINMFFKRNNTNCDKIDEDFINCLNFNE